MDNILHPLRVNPEEYVHKIRIQEIGGKKQLWDPVRRKWIFLNPEEWVRQIYIQMLAVYFPFSRMAVEKQVSLSGKMRRFDLLVYDQELQPLLLAEFKRPDVAIDFSTFEQAASYISVVRTPFLLMSNGRLHYLAKITHTPPFFIFYEEWPFALQ